MVHTHTDSNIAIVATTLILALFVLELFEWDFTIVTVGILLGYVVGKVDEGF